MGRQAAGEAWPVSFLLDAHAMIWWWTASPKLGSDARAILEGGSPVFVSAASVWEIATKSRLGKLPEIADFAGQYGPLMQRDGFETLAVSDAHSLRAGYLPGKHRDPFDRMLAAQALIEDLTVLTRDREIAAFGCRTIW